MKIFRTHNFALIQNACLDAQVNRSIVRVVGASGLGMTTAFRFFQENGPTFRVWYLSVRQGCLKQWLKTIANQALPDNNLLPSSVHELTELIKGQVLDLQNTSPLLIVDDFRLNYDLIGLLDALQSFYWWGPELGIVVGTNRNEIARVRRNRNRIGRMAAKILTSPEFELQSPRRDEVAAIAGEDPSSDVVTNLVLNCPTYTTLYSRLNSLRS